MAQINKILIANRGEIALRVIRSCKDLGIQAVAVYSTPDAEAPYVLQANESIHIGPAQSSESYLNMDKIIQAVRETGANAVHPGYGFLSENADFSARCKKEGIIFIGPSPEVIAVMGDKTEARKLMEKTGIPFPPGTTDALQSIGEAEKIANQIGFPVLVKAAAGGGGKGMRVVDDPSQFKSSIRAAKSEAKNAFGDDRVYIEKYLVEPRHVEFQIMADQHGNVCHIYDRECSIQRRHQKVIEEAPCTILTPELREEMAEAAVAAAKACNYEGAGTIEFLVDHKHDFYFLEMNTRLQVEHPVTELITGLDLVNLQIRVAEGQPLPFTQGEVRKKGHAVECRIYAEDPRDHFLPSTGTLTKHRIPAGNGIRVDAGIEEGQEVTINYDPMIAKLCAYGADREQAINRMLRALDEYEIAGCKTTISFCRFVLQHEAFRSGQYDTHFVSDLYKPEQLDEIEDLDEQIASVTAALLKLNGNLPGQNQQKEYLSRNNTQESFWWKNRRG